MLALEDLVDLGEALRVAGFKVSTQQLMAAQQLLLRLAAEGALPAGRAALSSWLRPVLCTSAAEQAVFDVRYRGWLGAHFADEPAVEREPAPALPTVASSERRWDGGIAWLMLLLVIAGVAWFGLQRLRAPPPTAPVAAAPSASQAANPAATAPATGMASDAGAIGLSSALRVDLSGALPEPTFTDRLVAPNAAIVATPLLLFALWLLRWLLRRPVLRRIASRTPPQLREVRVPGAVRRLLPSLPLRRLAQELRRRRAVASSELQLEATVRATLARGGVFTPVRGSRVEPDYLALIDRAGLSDHQARLAAEIVAELARGDVLIDRYDFDRDARLVRSREALPQARGSSKRPAPARAVELAELHERLGEHRVLMFGDGAGCFDGYTGEPTPWALTLAAWPLPVLMTPTPIERWARREWALQRLGIQVLPLSAAGLVVLMGVMAGLGAAPAATEPPLAASVREHERLPRRWLERDAPAADAVEQLIGDLRGDLGARGIAWLAACAAYPEVHWGITLRLGVALLPDAAEFERLLPRLARMIWFRAAYQPDWLRERLLRELSTDDEAKTRVTLRAMLEAVARGSEELPLRIAVGAPGEAGSCWWRSVVQRWRSRGDRARAQEMLRTAPPDSPLRDHVFLRFLSGASSRRIDLRAPGALLGALRATPATRPFVFAIGAVLASIGLALVWSPWIRGDAVHSVGELRFAADPRSVLVSTNSSLEGARLRAGAATFALRRDATQWQREAIGTPSAWQAAAPGGRVVMVEQAGALIARRAGADGLWRDTALASGRPPTEPFKAAFSADGGRYATLERAGDLRVWDTTSGSMLVGVTTPGRRAEALEMSPDGKFMISKDLTSKWVLWSLSAKGATRDDWTEESVSGTLRFSPDSKSLATLQNTSVRLYDIVTRALLGTFEMRISATNLRFSDDGRLLAGWWSFGPAMVVDLADSQQRATALVNSTGAYAITFSPDGKRAAGIGPTGDLLVWDSASGRLLSTQPPVSAFACCTGQVSFSPDGTLLAAASATEVVLWRVGVPGGAAPAPQVLAAEATVAGPIASTGNVVWMIAATLLTGLMIPGLTLLCGGSVADGADAAPARTLLTFAMALALWFVFGYSLAFTEGNAFVGGLDRMFGRGLLDPVTGWAMQATHAKAMAATYTKGVYIPEWLFAAFEAMPPAIACCLLVRAFAGRVRFGAMSMVAALWLTFASVPITHMTWFWMGPDTYTGKDVVDALNAKAGLLWQWGALDFSGGYPMVINVAVAGVVGSFIAGRRVGHGKETFVARSPALAVVGVMLTWVGWLGWAAGSQLESGNTAVLALAGALWAPAAAVLCWCVAESTLTGRATMQGAVRGALAGLAASAPAAGNIGIFGSVMLGAVAGLFGSLGVNVLKKLWGGDELFDLFGALAVGGIVGALMTGVFNTQSLGGPGLVGDWVTASVTSNAIGSQIWIQAKALLLTVAWSGAVSFAAFKIADLTLGLRIPIAAELGTAPGAARALVAERGEAFERWPRAVSSVVLALALAGSVAFGAWAIYSTVNPAVFERAAPVAAAASPAASAATAAGAAASAASAASPAGAANARAAAAAAPAPIPRTLDVASMLIAVALAALMLPGLTLFSLERNQAREPASVAARTLIGFAVVTVLWVVFGYSLAFTEGNAYVGGFDRLFLKGVFDPADGAFAMAATFSKGVVIPELLYIVLQGLAAGVACSLIVVAFAERMKLAALLTVVALWFTFAYAPIVHTWLFWMGPDAYSSKEVVDAMNAKAGAAWQWGVLDLGGGYPVCIAVGVAGLVGVLFGRGRFYGLARPTEPLRAIAGIALLWLGWIGLNAGAALELGTVAALAAAGTFVAVPAATFTWCVLERMLSRRITLPAAASGAFAGLAAIMPAAGNVGLAGAMVIGSVAAIACQLGVANLQRLRGTDPALALFGTLAIGGTVGALLTGVFNSEALGGPGLVTDFVVGSISSNAIGRQVWIQLKGVLMCAAWSGVVAWVAWAIADRVIDLPRTADEEASPATV